MKIQKVDPFLAQYVYEKETKPEKVLVWRQFKEADVNAVDRLVALAHGFRDEVKTQSDWDVLEALLLFYSQRWPKEFEEFKETVKDIRYSRRAKGYSRSKEIMYVGALPPRFMNLIKVIFPMQKFDKKFIWRMVKRFPIFKVTGESN